MVLKSFDYENVSLGVSRWKTQFDSCLKLILSLDNDSLLYGFRKRAGLKVPGYSLTGWYKDGGSNFGQILSALAKMYKITKNILVREKLLFLIEEWAQTLDEDGFGLFPNNHNDTYLVEKLLGGLLDAYEYGQVEKALILAEHFANYTIENMPRDFKRDGLHHKDMLERYIIEWYTLPENMYRLYSLCKNEKYKDFAEEMEYSYYWDKLKNFSHSNSSKNPIGPRHAYSHVNTLSSAAFAYLVKKDDDYLKIMENGYKCILSDHTYATGGFGPAEILFGDEGYLGDSVKSPYDGTRKQNLDQYPKFCDRDGAYDNFEISCGSWSVFKLSNYLLKCTGKAQYGIWEEKLLYNGMGAQLPITTDGRVMYYGNYAIQGALKTVQDNRLRANFSNYRWQCCTGTYLQNVCEYYNMLYYHDDNSLYVNQYLPSKCQWDCNGIPVLLENVTQYPFKEKIMLSLSLSQDISFSLILRIPHWCSGQAEIRVNGVKWEKGVIAGEWYCIERKWSNFDVVTLYFPFSLRFEAIDKENKEIKALLYGPLVLAGTDMAYLMGDCMNPETWIKLIDANHLIFETLIGHDRGYDYLKRKFKPYVMFEEMEWYYLYNRILDTSIESGGI